MGQAPLIPHGARLGTGPGDDMLTVSSPDGYPHLGLSARTLPMRFRKDANLSTLARRLERWEADHGNPLFETRNLHRVPASTAFELVNVYVALREWFPSVRLDYLNFASHADPDVLGFATQYTFTFPRLREMIDPGDDPALLDTIDDELLCEIGLTADVTEVHNSGSIDLHRTFTSGRGQKQMVRYWRWRNEVRARNRRPCRIPPLVVTPAAMVLVHEFGHLVESELAAGGWQALEPVYAALSEVLLDVQNPDVSQWRYHLVNYPARDAAGPAQGGPARQRQTVRALRDVIGQTLGSYAPTSRDELFADAFALAHCGSPELRRRLFPMLAALRDCGARKARRR